MYLLNQQSTKILKGRFSSSLTSSSFCLPSPANFTRSMTSSFSPSPLNLPRFDLSSLSASSLQSSIDHAFVSAKSIPNKLIELGSEEDLVICDKGVPFLITVMSSSGYTRKNEISPANLISNDKGSSKRSWPPVDAFDSLDDGSISAGGIVSNGEEASLKLSDQAVVCEISTTPSSSLQKNRPLFAIALNKFPARAKHLLIISRRWAPQSSPLDRGSFEVLWACVSLLKGVAFFNGGFRSGASQPRRHCQFIPFESLKEVARLYGGVQKEDGSSGDNVKERVTLPIHHLILAAEASLNPKRGVSFTISQFNFKHRFAIVRDMAYTEVFEIYKTILSELDLPCPDEENTEEEEKSFKRLLHDPLRGLPRSAAEDAGSHNVVVTEEFMFVVPRVTDGARDDNGEDIVGVNALLFCGLALVKKDGVSVIKRLGCFEVMKRVSFSYE